MSRILIAEDESRLVDFGSADVMVLTAGDITLDLRTRRATVDTA
jgi:hypothetical protein